MDNHFLQAAAPKPAAALVIGGGIGGMRAALDLADAGLKVYLVEQTPCLGGRVAQLGFMFPQHDCVLCRGTPDHGYGCTRPSISPAYLQNNQHPNINILTNTQVIEVEGQAYIGGLGAGLASLAFDHSLSLWPMLGTFYYDTDQDRDNGENPDIISS